MGRRGSAEGAAVARPWDGAHLLPEAEHLIQNHLPHLIDLVNNLKVEIEGGRAIRLVTGVVPDGEVGVLQGGLDADATGGVKSQHAIQQVESVRVGIGEERRERLLGHEGKVANVFLGAGRADAGEGLFVGCSQDVQNLVQLIDVITTLEEGAATEEFSKDTSNGPDIN